MAAPTLITESLGPGGIEGPVAGARITHASGQDDDPLEYAIKEGIPGTWSAYFPAAGLDPYTPTTAGTVGFLLRYYKYDTDYEIRFRYIGETSVSGEQAFRVDADPLDTANAGLLSLEVDWDRDGLFASVASMTHRRISGQLTCSRGRPPNQPIMGQATAGDLSVELDNHDHRFSPHMPASPLFGKDVRGTNVILRLNNRPVWGGRVSEIIARQGSDRVTLKASGLLSELNQRDWGSPDVSGEAWELHRQLALSGAQAYENTYHRAHDRQTADIDNYYLEDGNSNYRGLAALADGEGDWVIEDEFGDARVMAFNIVEARRRLIPVSVDPAEATGYFSVRDHFTSIAVDYLSTSTNNQEVFDETYSIAFAADEVRTFIITSNRPVFEWDDPVLTGGSGLSWAWGLRYSKVAELLITDDGSAHTLTGITVDATVITGTRRVSAIQPQAAITSLNDLDKPPPGRLRPWATDFARANTIATYYATNVMRNIVWRVEWYGFPTNFEISDAISFTYLTEAVGGNITWLRYELDRGLVLKTTAVVIPVAVNNAQVIVLGIGPGLGTGQLGF